MRWRRFLTLLLAPALLASCSDTAAPLVGPDAVPPDITTTSLPEGMVGHSYNATLEATGGGGPYRWSLTPGILPSDLHLSSAGVISGVPTRPQVQTFTVRVTGDNDQTDTRPMALGVRRSPDSDIELGVGFGDEQFAQVHPGTFQMGSKDFPWMQPIHTVTLTRSFYLQRTPPG